MSAPQLATVSQYLDWMQEGRLTSEQLVQACLDHIAETDEAIGAWVHCDSEQALQQARAADDQRRRGKPLGALHGIPVGIKDIFDTRDYPTERGSAIYQGRQPQADAAVVDLWLFSWG